MLSLPPSIRAVPRALVLPRPVLPFAISIPATRHLARTDARTLRALPRDLLNLALFVLLAAGGLVSTLAWSEQSRAEGVALGAAVLLGTAAGFWSLGIRARYVNAAQAFVALASASSSIAALRLAHDGLAAACADPYQLVCVDTSQHLATVAPIYLAAALSAGVAAAFLYTALAARKAGR